MRPPLPPALIATAQAYAAGERVAAEPRDAATVLLLRDIQGEAEDGAEGGAGGVEVFVMVRRTSMAFAGGMVAFPGGGVSVEDAVEGEAWAARLGVTPIEAGSVVACALRELEEETGVVVSDLGAWDAWTTPVFEPRRYRTWFFAAALPEGQEPLELSTESSSVAWVSPSEAMRRADAGEWMMLPPTYCSMLRLERFGSVAEVMAETREAAVEMFLPELVGETLSMPVWAEPLWEARSADRS